MDMITVSAKTLDEAITKALIELQTTSDHLYYEIVQKESSGFLGFFGKPCIIRVRVMSEEEERALKKEAQEKSKAEKAKKAEKSEKKDRAEKTEKPEKTDKSEKTQKPKSHKSSKAEKTDKKEVEKKSADKKDIDKKESDKREFDKRDVDKKDFDKKESEKRDFDKRDVDRKKADRREDKSADKKEAKSFEKREKAEKKAEVKAEKDLKADKNQEVEKVPKARPELKVDEEAVKKAAKEFLLQVFGAMGMGVSIESEYHAEEGELLVMMAGDDMGILIGKRGQTLDSLQYLVSLVVNKETEGYLRVKLDTENYRERRKETLETLAKNISYKVKRTKRPVSLEPMNPYERRIIHSALQNDRYVVTRSEGEDPYRHVVISLKRESYNSGRRERYGSRRERNSERNTERGAERNADKFSEKVAEKIAEKTEGNVSENANAEN